MAIRHPERALPRSALRYRPIAADDQAAPAPVVSRAHRTRPDARMTAPPAAPDDGDRRKHAPGHRVSTPAPRQSAPPTRTRRHIHPLLFVGLGLVVTTVLWIGISWLASWGTYEWNMLRYGDPRTFQVDAVVGHRDNSQHPSHFVAINLHGVVTILEFPAGDPGRARVLATTSVLGPNADQAVALLRFIDVTHRGTPDMLITIDGLESVLINDGQTFRPPTPAEQQQVLQSLR